MADGFANAPSDAMVVPAGKMVEVTASANPLADGTTRGLYVEAAGEITVTIGGASVTFAAVAGYHPLRVTHVTAGTGVFALY